MTTFRGPPPETEEGMGALTLSGFLLEVTRRYPEREAVVFHEPDGREVRWSYRDLEREARRVAHAVLGTGAGKDSRVGILMGNRPEWVAALYGVALAGAVAVPLNTYFEPPELDCLVLFEAGWQASSCPFPCATRSDSGVSICWSAG